MFTNLKSLFFVFILCCIAIIIYNFFDMNTDQGTGKIIFFILLCLSAFIGIMNYIYRKK